MLRVRDLQIIGAVGRQRNAEIRIGVVRFQPRTLVLKIVIIRDLFAVRIS